MRAKEKRRSEKVRERMERAFNKRHGEVDLARQRGELGLQLRQCASTACHSITRKKKRKRSRTRKMRTRREEGRRDVHVLQLAGQQGYLLVVRRRSGERRRCVCEPVSDCPVSAHIQSAEHENKHNLRVVPIKRKGRGRPKFWPSFEAEIRT
jgi:hypothetical protein